jgi:outer membrane protein assembly factor BamA
MRGVGPGNAQFTSRDESYLAQVGEMKLVMNLEWRYRLFGSLYSAIFLDAGNVWDVKSTTKKDQPGAHFKMKNMFKEMALGTGVGIRYDFDFLVLRLDWGVGLHMPYDTGRSGYFNIGKFKDVQTLHFAIGYPF